MFKVDIGNLALVVIGVVLAHIGAFYKLNGKFIWKWFEKNEIAVAVFGFVVSFL